MFEDDELVGMVERQRPQQHRFDDCEERRVGADAERERQDRRGGESRLETKEAQRAANILHKHGEVSPSPIGRSP